MGRSARQYPPTSVDNMSFPIRLAVYSILVASVFAQGPVCARNYIVKLEDVCDSISAKENVSTFQLAHVNPQINSNCTNLVVGEPLCLGIEGQDCRVTTVIHAGDTCPTIAANAGITEALLLENNPNVDSICANIYPGEVLCTANRVFKYSRK